MKKLLSIIGAISIAGSGASAVVACGSSTSNPDQDKVNAIIKKIKKTDFDLEQGTDTDVATPAVKAVIDGTLRAQNPELSLEDLKKITYTGKLSLGTAAKITATVTIGKAKGTKVLNLTLANDNQQQADAIKEKISVINLKVPSKNIGDANSDSNKAAINEALKDANQALSAEDIGAFSYKGTLAARETIKITATITIGTGDKAATATVDLSVTATDNKDLTRNTSIPNIKITTSVVNYKNTKTNADIFFVGTANGLYSSSDGKTWNVVKEGLEDKSITSITELKDANNNSLYFVGTTSGLWTSSDGQSWTADPTVNRSVTSIPVKINNTYYIGTSKALYRSTDGQSWSAVSGFDGDNYISTSVVFAPSAGDLPATYYVGTNGDGLYSSTDGTAWSRVESVSTEGDEITTISSSGEEFIIGTDEGIWVNEGKTDSTWTQVPFTKDWAVLTPPFEINGNQFVGTKDDLYKISNNVGVRQYLGRVSSTATMIGTTAYIATTQGLFYSKDGGDNWLQYLGLPNGTQITAKPVQLDDKMVNISTNQGLYYYDGNLPT